MTTTTTPGTMSTKKWIYILPSNFLTIRICSVCQLVWKPAQTKYVMPAINSKKKYKKFAVVA